MEIISSVLGYIVPILVYIILFNTLINVDSEKKIVLEKKYKDDLLRLLRSKKTINSNSLKFGNASLVKFYNRFGKKLGKKWIQFQKSKYIIIQYGFFLEKQSGNKIKEVALFCRNDNKNNSERSLSNTNSLLISTSPLRLDPNYALAKIICDKIDIKISSSQIKPHSIIYVDGNETRFFYGLFKRKKADYLFIIYKLLTNESSLSKIRDHVDANETEYIKISDIGKKYTVKGKIDQVLLKYLKDNHISKNFAEINEDIFIDRHIKEDSNQWSKKFSDFITFKSKLSKVDPFS